MKKSIVILFALIASFSFLSNSQARYSKKTARYHTQEKKIAGGKLSSSLVIKKITKVQIEISIEAFWLSATNNIHTGEFLGVAEIKSQQAHFMRDSCEIILTFKQRAVSVLQKSKPGTCDEGRHVSFTGEYTH